MRVPIEPKVFAEEHERFGFRCCCEDCVYFISEEERCAHYWPVALHRKAHVFAQDRSEILFCKEFELS